MSTPQSSTDQPQSFDWRKNRRSYFEHLYLDQPPKQRWTPFGWADADEFIPRTLRVTTEEIEGIREHNAASKKWITAADIKQLAERNDAASKEYISSIIRNLETAQAKEFVEDLTEDEACAICMAAGVPSEIDPVTFKRKFDPCGLYKVHGQWMVAIPPQTRFPR